jgi:hypothetical protein
MLLQFFYNIKALDTVSATRQDTVALAKEMVFDKADDEKQKVKVKLSRYTPWRHMGEEKV